MELTGKLKDTVRLSSKKKADTRLIIALGVFGLLVLLMTVWPRFTDWRSQRQASAAQVEGRQFVERLIEPIQALKAVLTDTQVQELARRAVENPERLDDLTAYLTGRENQIRDARVFGVDAVWLNPSALGENGLALYDMILSVLDGNRSQLQVHYVFQPPRMYDAVPVMADDEILGVLLVEMAPEFLLAGLQPDLNALPFLRVTQYNGREPLSILGAFGDSSQLGDQPERIAVPGSLFRVEYPGQQRIELLGGGMAMLMMLVGLLCLAASIVLYRSNKQWALEQKIEAAAKKRESAPSARLEADDEAPRIAPSQPPADPAGEPVSAESDEIPAEAVDVEDEAPPEPPPMRLHYDIAERHRQREAKHTPVALSPEIFRAYDIRGVIDKTLDSGVARSVGQAVGSLALERDAAPVVVARDGRLSGPYLMEGMIEGIVSTGCDVLDIGAVPTGVLYYAAHELAAGSGVMITGSHNPPDYNGFKVMIGGDTLHGAAIKGLYDRIASGQLAEGEGQVTERDVISDYIERVAADVSVEKPLRVVIDCGNGIGGVCAADTLRALGVEVLPLFDEVDGTFPNHHPDPSEPENLVDLIESVRLMDADLGLALDGDADRLGVVTLAGDIIYPDRVMMLLALDVLDRHPGATIIYDVKCTGHLPNVIREAGGNPVMYKTGHSLIKARMKEIGSPFAGEMSGHFFFGDRWNGVDDGIYAAARLLEILGGTETPPEAILNALPTSYSTPELKVQMNEGENHDFIEAFRATAKFEGAEVSTIDGLRADYEDGWGLVRASNTTPILVVRFDAETEEALERIKSVFRAQMLQLVPTLELPF